MADANTSGPQNAAFHDTVAGKILIGCAIAAFSAGLAAIITWSTTANQPPKAVIKPETAKVAVIEALNLSAAEALDPEGDELRFSWSLNGLPMKTSQVGSCTSAAHPANLTCQFVMPGTHAVTVEVSDRAGLIGRASASVAVSAAGGFVGFVVLGGSGTGYPANRILLHAVEWKAIQALIPRPIVLFDPDTGQPAYAATVDRDLVKAKQAVEQARVGSLKLIGVGLGPQAQDLISRDLLQVGVHVSWMQIPFGEVYQAMQEGAADGGSTLLTSPEGILDFLSR